MYPLTIQNQKTACLVVLVCEDQEIHDHPEILALVENAKKITEFSGKKDDLLVLYDPADIAAARILFVGLGKTKQN
ncbi:MAG: M17 family peptidase N-terminal domain-containing protein [Desulfobacterales bacterium]